jgi:flagellar basal body-associated protein FliL
MEIPLVTPGKEEEPRRTVLDQSQVLADTFDEDVLAEIERRLDREDGPLPASPGEKVELDKADLPILSKPASLEPPPEVEVDLSGEAPDLHVPLEAPAPAEEGPPKRRLGLYLGLGAALALLVVGGVGAWLFLSRSAPAPAPVQAPTPATASAPAPAPAPGLLPLENAPEAQPPQPKPEAIYKLEPFLVPLLKSKGGGRLLRLGVSLEVVDPAVRGLLLPRQVALRDVIYRLLRDRPADEIQGARSKHLLETQIKTELNHFLGAEVVGQVHFTEFMING